jgi:adhesin transport system outer membrane protein
MKLLRVSRRRRALLLLCIGGWLLPLRGAECAQTLEQLMAAAAANHPTAQAQRALLAAAESGVDAARWQFFPTASLAAEAASAGAADRLFQGDSRVVTLRLQQPLWAGGRLVAGLGKAEGLVGVGQAAADEVAQQLALLVLQAYGDWHAAHLKTVALDKSVTTHLQLRSQVERRIAVGASAASDLALAVARLESVVADAAAVRAQRAIALARLGQLLGQTVTSEQLLAAAPQPQTVGADAQALVAAAARHSPALLKARARTTVQAAVVSERRADLAPEVYLRAERQYGDHVFANAPPQSRVFIGFNTRFGAGLSVAAGVSAARAEQQAAEADLKAQERAVAEQVMTDQALALSTASRIRALESSLRAATEVSASYDRQFLAGRKSWLDVMNAARELAQTEMQLADLQTTQLVASWRLAVYTRGLSGLAAPNPQATNE